MNNIEYLEWDSNFFKLKVGKISYENVKHLEYLHEIKNSNYDLIYIFNKINNPYTNLINSYLVDTKLNFTRKINNERLPLIDKNITLYESNICSKEIVNLCIVSGEYSRYKLDERFKESDFINLYTTWVENALNRTKKEKIFIYTEGGQDVGLIIVSFKEKIAVIEILAVDENHRGKGIAKKIINAALLEGVKNNCTEIRVATQKKNLPSSQLYSSCGFEIFEATDIYHLWL